MAKKTVPFSVRFRGVRGSHPVSSREKIRFGGNTACVEVRAGKNLLILDAGTGIVELGYDLVKNTVDIPAGAEDPALVLTILFSHTHHDHTQGLAFFRPAYLPSTACYLLGPRLRERELAEGISKAMISPYFPVELSDLPSIRNIRSLKDSDILLFDSGKPPAVYNYFRDNHADKPYDLRVLSMHSLAHPNGGVFVYRIEANGKSIVYATDTEGYVGGDQRLIRFAEGADLLIHDSQYMPQDYICGDQQVQGFGHSSVEMAADVAAKASVGKLALFHYDPRYDDSVIDDMERVAREVFPETVAAYEGLEIQL